MIGRSPDIEGTRSVTEIHCGIVVGNKEENNMTDNYNDDYRIQEINIDDVEIIAPLKYFVNYFNTSNCCYYLFDNEYHDSFEDIYPLKIGTSNEYHDSFEDT